MPINKAPKGWGLGGFGSLPFGNPDSGITDAEISLTSFQLFTGSGRVFVSGGAFAEISGEQLSILGGFLSVQGSASIFVEADSGSLISISEFASSSGSGVLTLNGDLIEFSIGEIQASGNAQAQLVGSGFQAYAGYAGPEVLKISASEFAELFWQDPRALTLSKYLIGGGGGVPSATGDCRKLIDMVLAHPKALTSAKLLALGD